MSRDIKSPEGISGMDTGETHQKKEALEALGALQEQRLPGVEERVDVHMLVRSAKSDSSTSTVNTGGSVEKPVSRTAPEATSATSLAQPASEAAPVIKAPRLGLYRNDRGILCKIEKEKVMTRRRRGESQPEATYLCTELEGEGRGNSFIVGNVDKLRLLTSTWEKVDNKTEPRPEGSTEEKGPILGMYLDKRDGQTVLCEVYRDGDVYGYKVLDVNDRGDKVTVGDASQLRALLNDSWQKVDDATEPQPVGSAEATPAPAPVSPDAAVASASTSTLAGTPESPVSTADASVPKATPSSTESAPGETLRFTPLKKGEQVVYSGTEGRVKVTGLGGNRYALEDAGGKVLEADEERVQNLAREEEWTPDVIPTVNDVMEPKGFRPLSDGGRAHYIVTATNEVIVVERDRDDYIVSRGGNYIPYSEADIVALAEGEEWQWYADGLRDEDLAPGESAPVSEPATPAETGPEQSELARLEAEVQEARLEYVRTDYHQKKLWNRISGVLTFLRDKARQDNDTEDARKRYESALSSLRNYRLGELKERDLSPAELHKEMGAMLMYYKHDELINLANDRTKVWYEHMNLPKKAIKVMEEAGKAYNKLKPGTKIALAVAVFGGAAAAGATAGAVGTIVGLSAVTLRRVVTILGAGVSADMATAQLVEYLQEKKAKKELKEDMAEFAPLTSVGSPETSMDEQLQRLNELSEREIKSLDRKFQRQKLIKQWRKGAVWVSAVGASAILTYRSFAGVSAGAGSTQDNYRAGLTRALDQTPGDGTLASPEGGAPAPGTGASAPGTGASGAETGRGGVQGAISQESSVRPISHRERIAFLEANGVPVDDAGTIDQARSALLERAGTMFQQYEVQAIDGKRGLWGILDKRLPDSMPKGPGRDQIIAKIEALMRQDLAKMTLAQQAEAGFAEGNLDLIHKGDVIRFDKFPSLTPERLGNIWNGEPVSVPQGMDGAMGSGSAPSTIPDVVSAEEKARILKTFADPPKAVAEPVKAPTSNLSPDDAEKQRLSNYRISGAGDGGARVVTESTVAQGADGVARETVTMTPAEVARPENFRVFLEQNPELAHSHRITLSGIKTATFSMPDVVPEKGVYMAPIDGGYHPFKHGQVYMGRVLEWKQDFATGRLAPHEFDRGGYPLRTTQVDRLLHLIRVATHGTIFGEAGRPLPDETIDRYLNRIAALTTITGKEALLAQRLGFGK